MIREEMLDIGRHSKIAAAKLAVSNSKRKMAWLKAIADSIQDSSDSILAANARDLNHAKLQSVSESFLDRLKLNGQRILQMANGIREIAQLSEPVGRILATTIRPNGLRIEKISTPIGVIGVIFESRPNVTADAAALCLKSGNAVILRGGSAAINSNQAIHRSIVDGLTASDGDPNFIQLVARQDRAVVGEMLTGLQGCIDVIVPRGGESLVQRIQSEARVPIFAHLEGVCHTYIHEDADAEKALKIVVNAKMRRTGICGATETLLVDRGFKTQALIRILEILSENGCEIRGDDRIGKCYPTAKPTSAMDWSTEYLGPTISVRVVENIEQAVAHIVEYSTNHTESIVTENQYAAEYFLQHVDSAIVMHNASTQFADGGEFGMGAEIGIATGKLHARGPVGVEQLTTFKYIVHGDGQIRE